MRFDSPRDSIIQQRVVRGTASNYIGQIVAFGTLFFLTPFILHHLGATTYGLWVLIGSLVGYGSLLDLGLWSAVIKYVAECRARGENERAQSLLATTLSLYTLLGLIVVLLTSILAFPIPRWFGFPPEQQILATRLMLLMGFGVGFSLPGTMPLAVLRGLQRYDLDNLVQVTATLFTATATVAVLLFGGGVLGVAAANLGGLFVMLVLSAWFVHNVAPEMPLGWRGTKWHLVRGITSYSWPLLVVDVAGRLKTKTDEITIGAFLPVAAIAPYNIARRLSESTNILARQFAKVMLPLASEFQAGNDLFRLRFLYTAGIRLTLALSMGIGGTLIVFARPILTVWVGPAYATASSLVAILTIASIFASGIWAAGAILRGMARHRLLAATALGSGLLNLALSIALVRPYGLTGVALGTLIPAVIEFGIVIPYTMRVVGVSAASAVREMFLPAVRPAVLTLMVLYLVQDFAQPASLLWTAIAAGFGLVFYGIAYLVIGASDTERQIYQGVARSTFHSARKQLRERVQSYFET